MINITLPDGSRREFDNPVTVGDIAASICLGVLTDVLIKVVTGDAKKVHPVLYVLCIPLVLYFIV